MDISVSSKVIEHLRQFGLLAYPTETIWGLGSLITSDKAIQRIFEVKGRPTGMALSVLVRDLQMAHSLAHLSPELEQVLCAFWPGPLTVVVPAKKEISHLIHAGSEYVGLRCSSHPYVKALMMALNQPLITTSLNPSGQAPAKFYHELDWVPEDVLKVDYQNTEETNSSLTGSTVVKFFPDKTFQVLRAGDLELTRLEPLLVSLGFKKNTP